MQALNEQDKSDYQNSVPGFLLLVKKIAGFVRSIVLLFAVTRWIKMERVNRLGT